jgi:hypothetical protein
MYSAERVKRDTHAVTNRSLPVCVLRYWLRSSAAHLFARTEGKVTHLARRDERKVTKQTKIMLHADIEIRPQSALFVYK